MKIKGLPVIGRGRSATVYDNGDHTVIRRHRDPGYDATDEADAMRRAATTGVPVPTVHDVDGPDLLMDRVDGPTLLEQLVAETISSADAGVRLAELHRALDPTTRGDLGLVHGDLHPGNVIMTASGPVLIDWTNHRTGPRALDVALSWTVLACFEPDASVASALHDQRTQLVEAMLSGLDRQAAATALTTAVDLRSTDPGTSDLERTRMRHLLATLNPPR